MVRTGSARAWLALAFLVADAFLLSPLTGCSGGSESEAVVVPSTPIAMSAAPGRGLANPWSIVPSADGKTLLVQERAAGRLARVDVASGTITRLESPSTASGAAIALAADPADRGSALVLLGGFQDGPVDPPRDPAASGYVYRIGIENGGWEIVMYGGFGGKGFFVDGAGSGAYTLREGVDHLDFATGARERLDRCTEYPDLALVDPLGRGAFSMSAYGAGVHTSPMAFVTRCDLATGESVSTTLGYELEAISLGCGSARVFRGQEGFVGDTPDGVRTTRLYQVLDATTLAALDPIDVGKPVPGLVAPGGPVATDADCARLWFGTPSGLFAYDGAGQSVSRIVEGATPVWALAAGDRPGTAFTVGGSSAPTDLGRFALDTGDFGPPIISAESLEWPIVGMEWSPGAQRLRVATSPLRSYYYPPFLEGFVRVDEIDPTTGAISKGTPLDRSQVWDTAKCADGDRLFLVGRQWTENAIESEDHLFEYRDGSVRPVRSLVQTLGSLQGYPGHGRLAMSRDCSTAFIAGDALYRVPTKGGAISDVPATIGSAMVMDPRQDLLVVESETNLYGLDLHHGTLNLLAGLREPVLDMTMTDDGKIVWTGATSLGLGVIDLVNGTSARLWEGAGTYGR